MTASIVVRRILLSANQHLRVEKLPVGSGPDLIDRLHRIISITSLIALIQHFELQPSQLHLAGTYRRIQIDKDRTRHVLPRASLREESLEAAELAIGDRFDLGRVGLAVLLKTVFQEIATTRHVSIPVVFVAYPQRSLRMEG